MTLATLLRRMATAGQYGHSRTPENYFMDGSYTSFYWDNRGICPDYGTWLAVAKLSERHRRFVRYVREVLPQWREVRREHFMDNSVEAIQVSRNGRERRVMVVAPSGDAC